MSLSTIHDQLLRTCASGSATVGRVKELLTSFNSLLPAAKTQPTPDKLLKCEFMPVTLCLFGESDLCTSETEFFIADRADLFTAFGERVPCLDFSLQEVCQLRPLIVWAGLESRYLSRCVHEASRVEGGVEMPISNPDRDVKRKAYGLLRYVLRTTPPRKPTSECSQNIQNCREMLQP